MALIGSAALAGAALPALGLLAGTASAATESCSATAGVETCVFGYDGSATNWAVPAGVTTLNVTADGADGGNAGGILAVGHGGAGGEMQATLSSIPAGTTLVVFPGGAGHTGGSGGTNLGPVSGTSSGGAAGSGSVVNGGGGGGASTVSVATAGSPFSNLLVVGGGGGGGSTLSHDGGNGGTTGATSGTNGDGGSPGHGATVSGAGSGGSSTIIICSHNGASGNALTGGAGGSGSGLCLGGGGGGGSGYYGGGGGGAGAGSSGGGGSSFPASATTVDAITVTPGTASNTLWHGGDGLVTISYNIPTSTSVSCSPNPSTAGDPVTCTATVTPSDATGTVDFTHGVTTLCAAAPVSAGTATCTTSSLPPGSDLVTATYTATPGTGWLTSSGNTTQVVTAIGTHLRAWLVVHSNGTYTLFAQLTAGYSGVSGQTIQFSAGRSGPALCTAVTNAAGIAACHLDWVQTHELLRYWGSFTASYAASGNYAAASAYYPGIMWWL